MSRPVLAPAEFTRRAAAVLAFDEARVARLPVEPPSDDPAEQLRRIAADQRTVRIVWHATGEGVEDAPLADCIAWDDCGSDSKSAGAWAKGSGYYRVLCETGGKVDERVDLLCHYRKDNEREDPARGVDSNAKAKADADLWMRLRAEAADRYEEVKRLRGALDNAQTTISTHLGTIATQNARIVAYDAGLVPNAEPPHFMAPVMEQIAGYLAEAKSSGLIDAAKPTILAEIKARFTEGAHAVALQERLDSAQPAYQALLDAIRDAGGLALKLADPTPEQVVSYRCPREGCDAERGEPCLDGEAVAEESHAERVAFARMPRDLKAALKKAGAEAVPIGPAMGDDVAVVAAVHALAHVLKMDEWKGPKDAAEPAPEEPPTGDATPAPAPPAPTPPPAPASAAPPKSATIPDAIFEEAPTGDAPSRPIKSAAVVSLDTPEAREAFAASVAARKAEIAATAAKIKAKADAINARKDAEASTDPSGIAVKFVETKPAEEPEPK